VTGELVIACGICAGEKRLIGSTAVLYCRHCDRAPCESKVCLPCAGIANGDRLAYDELKRTPKPESLVEGPVPPLPKENPE
jgi:hypothetical protein